MDTWQAIKVERAALVDGLSELSPAQWDGPSLCSGWTVRDVVAHIVATASMTPPRFIGRFVGAGFSFPAMVGKDIAALTGANSDAQLVGLLRERIGTRNAAPGPTMSWLGETIVHGEDIFRGLGAYRGHSAEHLAAVAGFYAGSNALIGAKRRVEGTTLRATDTGWSHGSGPEVSGPLVAIVMAMTGRKAALDDLAGDGVQVLRSRP